MLIINCFSPSSCGETDATEPRVSHVGELEDLDVGDEDEDDDDGSESGGSNADQADILGQEEDLNEHDIDRVRTGKT